MGKTLPTVFGKRAAKEEEEEEGAVTGDSVPSADSNLHLQTYLLAIKLVWSTRNQNYATVNAKLLNMASYQRASHTGNTAGDGLVKL